MPRSRRLSDNIVKQIYELKDQGLSNNQIARKLGISPTSVSRYLNPERMQREIEYQREYRAKKREKTREQSLEDRVNKRLDAYARVLELLRGGERHERAIKKILKEEQVVKDKPGNILNHLESAGLVSHDRGYYSLTEEGRLHLGNKEKLKETVKKALRKMNIKNSQT